MSWFCSNSSKRLFVKIVHPGGHVELHDRPILAAELLGRNPKCCVAHPTVFQHPNDVVSPETTLLLGRKYYVVPLGTIRKLQLKHRRGGGDRAAARGRIGGKIKEDCNRDRDSDSSSSACWLFGNGKKGEMREKSDSRGGGGLGTKIRAASSESSGEETVEVAAKRENGGGGGGGGRRRGGDAGSSSPGRISLVSMDTWQPDLHSICEEY